MAQIAGTLRDKVLFYEEQSTKSDSNAKTRAYAYAFSMRGNIVTVSGKEALHAGLELMERIVRVKFRYRKLDDTKKRLMSFDGDFYEVKYIDTGDRRTYMIITGERAAPGAHNIV